MKRLASVFVCTYHWQIAGANDWLPEVVAVLRQGGVALIPTETAYGLAAVAIDQDAVRKVYDLKGRPISKPLSLLVGSLAMAERYVEFNPLARRLGGYWPGPLTLVLPVTEQGRALLAPECISERGEVALRVSPHPFLVELFKHLDAPITATSANLAGAGECYSVGQVLEQLATTPAARCGEQRPLLNRGGDAGSHLPDVIIDAGELARVRPSTIARVGENGVEVLREGLVTVTSSVRAASLPEFKSPDAGLESRKQLPSPPLKKGGV